MPTPRVQFGLDVLVLSLIAYVLAFALVAPVAGWAQDTGSTRLAAANDSNRSGAEQTANISSRDKKFVKETAMGGLFEVQAGQLALSRAGSESVRQLAQHIVDDHTQANARLQSIAASKGIADLPTALDSKHAKQIDRLQKLSGNDFDRKYAALMVSDHKDDIKAFRKEAAKGTDPDIKQFAADTTPKLEEHLKMSTEAKHASHQTRTPSSSSSSNAAGNPRYETSSLEKRVLRAPLPEVGSNK